MRATHQPGEMLHHAQYRVEAVLGEGGQGVVYRAQHVGLQASVAVKELFQALPEVREHFLWQAQVLLRLSHPALPRVLDFFEQEGRSYLVMEFIEGMDLHDWVVQNGPAPAAQVLAWAAPVLDALDYLHAQEPPIIHRDIKPANLKLAPDGRLFLVDFGLAKVGGLQHSTVMVAKGYTHGFSPPEQYGVARSDERSDLYALGGTLYFLLTGQVPLAATLRASGEVLPTIRALAPSVPRPVEAWVERAMLLPRETRWPSAQAMQGERDALAKRLPPPALGPNAATTAIHPPRLTTARRHSTPRPTTAPRVVPVPSSRWPWVAGLGTFLLLLLLGGALLLQQRENLARSGAGGVPSPTSEIGIIAATMSAAAAGNVSEPSPSVTATPPQTTRTPLPATAEPSNTPTGAPTATEPPPSSTPSNVPVPSTWTPRPATATAATTPTRLASATNTPATPTVTPAASATATATAPASPTATATQASATPTPTLPPTWTTVPPTWTVVPTVSQPRSILVDSFGSVGSYSLNTAWNVNSASVGTNSRNGINYLALTYTINGSPPDDYAVAERCFVPTQDWTGANALQVTVVNDSLPKQIAIQFGEGSRCAGQGFPDEVWRVRISLGANETRNLYLPFNNFGRVDWAPSGNGRVDTGAIGYLAVGIGASGVGSGSVLFSPVQAVP